MVAEESLCQKLGCILTYSLFVNKDNSSSNLVLSLFHVYWLNEYVDYVIYMIFILPIIYICMRYYLKDLLFAGGEVHP